MDTSNFEVSKEYISAGLAKRLPWATGDGIRGLEKADPIAGLKMLREARFQNEGRGMSEEWVRKGFISPTSATSGLAQYDLEQGARLLYPITTILRNMIPRVTGGTGIQANWRSVTAVNPARISASLSEGQRGGAMSQTVTQNFAAFTTNGLDNFVTEQAYLAGLTFEDLMSLASTETLQGVMEAEELTDIGGNNSILLGTVGTVTAAAHTTGGTLPDATYSVICVALTFDGVTRSTVSPVGVQLPYTRANLDGTTDLINGFCGIQSANTGSLTVSGGTNHGSVTASVASINGAFGYAWYLGTAGSETISLISGSPSVTLTTQSGSNQAATALPATDTSVNALEYNGILTQIVTPSSGAYVKDLAGAALTTSGSGSGGILEIDAMISDRISNYRLVPTDIIVSPYDHKAMKALILTGNTNLAPFFMNDSSSTGIAGSSQVKTYTNPVGFGTPELKITAHPFMPKGTMLFYSRTNPYPLSNVSNLLQKTLRRDYWSVDWPVTTMKRTMGVYWDGVLQCYFPPAYGVITGMNN